MIAGLLRLVGGGSGAAARNGNGHSGPSGVEAAEIKLRTADGTIPLTIKDLCGHVAVIGMTGSGKTAYLFNQILEETLRATGRFGPEAKAGFFLLDGKGDLARTLERLAPKHGREADMTLFGPNNPRLAMDPFANIMEEDATIYAYMLLTLQQALDDGAKSKEPFWEKMALKLATAIFALYKSLRLAQAEGKTGIALEPMSFRLLNLLYLDRGAPRNQMEILLAEEKRGRILAEAGRAASVLLANLHRLQMCCDALTRALSGPHSFGGEFVAALSGDPDASLSADRTPMSVLGELLAEMIQEMAAEQFPPEPTALLAEVCQSAAGRCLTIIKSLSILPDYPSDIMQVLGEMTTIFRETAGWFAQTAEYRIPEPETGILSSWLAEYERLLKEEGRETRSDPVLSFFREEYFAKDNAKMAGSVAATASNVTMLLSFSPFDRVFRPGGEFSFRKAIDEGLLVALDIDWERSMDAALAMAIVCKYDFFRSILGRKPGRGINLERPFLYLCDEFAMVASKGRWLGETAFIDKARGRRCPVVLSFQGFNTLESYGYSAVETKALLGNTTTKIFLRNDCPDTNRYASELMGKRIRADGSIDVDPGRRHLYAQGNNPSPDYRFSFREADLFPPDLFGRLQDGEAVVKLPPRMERKVAPVRFRLHPI